MPLLNLVFVRSVVDILLSEVESMAISTDAPIIRNASLQVIKEGKRDRFLLFLHLPNGKKKTHSHETYSHSQLFNTLIIALVPI